MNVSEIVVGNLKEVQGGPDKTFVLELPKGCTPLTDEECERMALKLSSLLGGAAVMIAPPGCTLRLCT